MVRFLEGNELTITEKKFLDLTIGSARKSTSKLGRRVGCLILTEDGNQYLGSVNERNRVIGTTCAERMAMDQLLRHSKSAPKIIFIVAKFDKDFWSDDDICTPCGVCREMFRYVQNYFKVKDLNFVCFSWNKKRALKAKLSDFLPEYR